MLPFVNAVFPRSVYPYDQLALSMLTSGNMLLPAR